MIFEIKNFKKSCYCSFCFIFLFLIPSCGENHNEEIDYCVFDGVKYSLISNEAFIDGKKYNNIWLHALSNSKKYLITSEVRNHNQPEIHLYDLEADSDKKISDNEFINYYPVINNNGCYSYAIYDSSDKSKINYNGKEFSCQNHVIALALDDENNLYVIEKNNHICKLKRINKDKTNFEYMFFPSDLKVTKFYSISSNKLLIQAYNNSIKKTKIFVYDIEKQNVTNLIPNDIYNAEIIRNFNNNTFEVDCFEEYSPLVYAYLEIIEESPSLSLSNCNNFQGRLTWYMAYKIYNLLQLYKKTSDYIVKKHLNLIVSNVINVQNKNLGIENDYTYDYGWATKKYSIDKNTIINLLVDDAAILYPLLLLCSEKNIITTDLKEKIIKTAEETFLFYEKDYNKGHYKFPKGIRITFDGNNLPWNQQNEFGLCCIELYKLTNNTKYKERAIELAKVFKEEIIKIDNRLGWYYWPKSFYKGWFEQDSVSVNTPMRHPSEPGLEDVSHAGISVKFILEIQKNFPNEVFSDDYIKYLTNTANSLVNGEAFFPVLYDDCNKISCFNDQIPLKAWLELDSNLKDVFSSYIENADVFFDSEKAIIYLNNNIYNNSIKLKEISFDNNLLLMNIKNIETNFSEYLLHSF